MRFGRWNPADPRAHNSLAIILKRIGWTNGAEVELQKALDLDPDYTEAHFNLAVMYLERKPPSLEMAGRHYRKARALGAAPDEIVEQQIRGESAVEESEVSEDESPGAPVGGASPGGQTVHRTLCWPALRIPPSKTKTKSTAVGALSLSKKSRLWDFFGIIKTC